MRKECENHKFLHQVVWSSRIKFADTDLKETMERKECPYLVTILNFHAFWFLIPFRIQMNENSNKYIMTTSRVRKILCAISNVGFLVFGALWMYRTLRLFLTNQSDVSTAFYASSQINTYAACIFFLKMVWQHQSEILEFVQSTSVVCTPSHLERRAKLLSVIQCMGLGLVVFIHRYLWRSDIDFVFMTFHKLISPLTSNWPWWSVIPKPILDFVSVVIFSYFTALFNLLLLTTLSLVDTMTLVAENEFKVNVENSYGSISGVLEHYKKIKGASEALKALFGNIVLTYYISVVSFYAESPQIFLNASLEGSTRVILTFYLILISVTMYKAARLNTMIEQCLRKFISTHHWQTEWTSTERLQLIAMSQELDAEPIGISCSFFSITNKFLASSIGLAITYSLIVFQVSGNEKLFRDN